MVIQLCIQELILPDHICEESGGIWLQQEGRQLLISTFNDYLAEIVEMDGNVIKRQAHINLYRSNLVSDSNNFVTYKLLYYDYLKPITSGRFLLRGNNLLNTRNEL